VSVRNAVAFGWIPDAGALDLLESSGSPFARGAFRQVGVESLGWHDASFGARDPDGTLAAVPILTRSRMGDSVPPSGYGEIVSTRPLLTEQAQGFLELAFRNLRLRGLSVRLLDPASDELGAYLAAASVLRLAEGVPPAKAYSRLSRRSILKASAAGATVEAGAGCEVFWPVYSAASAQWQARYPVGLVRRLIERRIGRVHAVRLDGRPVSVLLTLVQGGHWMCWLAGQTPEGRAVSASYLAYDALFTEAHAAGTPFVNLGASSGSGSEFKQHLGATDCPMRVWTAETATGRVRRRAGDGGAIARSVTRRGRGLFR
jgi:Acetyltransferase (GNAT) domain